MITIFFIIFYFFFQFRLLAVKNVSKNIKTSNINFKTFAAFQRIIHVIKNDITIQVKIKTIVANNQIIDTNFR